MNSASTSDQAWFFSSTSAAATTTGVTGAMTTNNQNHSIGKAAAAAASKKKSVSWGENIEYPAPSPMVDDGTVAVAAVAATGSSSSTSSAVSERYPSAEINGPDHRQHDYPPQHLPPHHHQQEAQSQKKSSYNSMSDEEPSDMSVCRLPGHTHIWKNCPDNPRSKRYNRGNKKKNTASNTAYGGERQVPHGHHPLSAPPHHHQQQQQQQQQQQLQQKMTVQLPPPLPSWKLGPLTPCTLPFPGHSNHVWRECPNNPRSNFFCGVSKRDLLFPGQNVNTDRTSLLGENTAPPLPLSPQEKQQEQQQRHQQHQQQQLSKGGVQHAGLPMADLTTYAAAPAGHSQQHQDYPHQHHHPRQQQHRQPQPLKQWGNNSTCKIPGHSGHLWKNCPNNPNSQTFDGNFASFLTLAPVGSVVASKTTSAPPLPPPDAAPDAAAPDATASIAASSFRGVAQTQPPTVRSSSNSAKLTMPLASSSSSGITRSTDTPGAGNGSMNAHHNIMTRSVPRKTSFLAPPVTTDLSRPLPQRTSSLSPPTTATGVSGGGGLCSTDSNRSTAPARSISLRASFLPPNSVAGGGNSTSTDRLFNKTDSARPIPRKTPKARVQQHTHQHQHQHIQSLQDPQYQQGQHIEKTFTDGIRGRRKIHRAPVGTDAMPLQKHTSSRLLKVQKGKDSKGDENRNLPEPHSAGEDVGGSPDGVPTLLVDGRKGGGGDEIGHEILITPASPLGTDKRRMEEDPVQETDSVPPPLKKRKSSAVQKGEEKKKLKNKKQREIGKVRGKGKGEGRGDALKLPSLQVSRQRTSAVHSTSDETFEMEGLDDTEDENEVNIADADIMNRAAIAALSSDDEIFADDVGADDTISFGDNYGEDVSMLDDDDHLLSSEGPSNGQGKVRCATASFPLSAPMSSKETPDESEDNDNATYMKALAALDYDVGSWKKLSFDDDMSILDISDLPTAKPSEHPSISQGKKRRKATKLKLTSIDSQDTSEGDGVSEVLDDDDGHDDDNSNENDDDEMIDKLEKELFDHIADNFGARKKLSSDDGLSISDNIDLPTSKIYEQPSISQGSKHHKVMTLQLTSIDSLGTSKGDGVSEALDDGDDDDDKMFDKVEKDLFDHIEQWNRMMLDGREREAGGREATEVARRQQPLRTGGDSGNAKHNTKMREKSYPPAKKCHENSRPAHQIIFSARMSTPWTEEEKRLYELGVQHCQNNWGKIASEYVKSRTAHQVREYARSCVGLSSSCQRSVAEEVIEPQSPQRKGKERQLPLENLPEESAGDLAVSTDFVLSLPEDNKSKDEWELLEKLQADIKERQGGGIIAIGARNSSPLPVSPNHNENTSTGTESSYGAANVSEDLDEDDYVKAFITCNKCCLVFDDMNKANIHEANCAFIANDCTDSRPLHGRVFHDKKTLLRYMYHRYLQPVMDREDEIYYCP